MLDRVHRFGGGIAALAAAIRAATPTGATIGRLAALFATLKGHHVNYTGAHHAGTAAAQALGPGPAGRLRTGRSGPGVLVSRRRPAPFARLETLIEQGLKRFPESAYFHVAAANLEVAAGPWSCRRTLAIGHYRQAWRCWARPTAMAKRLLPHRKFTTESPWQCLLRAGLVEQAQQGLSLLGDDGRPLEAFDDEFGFGSDDDFEDDDFEDDDFDDEYDDEFEDDGPLGFVGRPPGRRRGGSRRGGLGHAAVRRK